MRVLLRIVILMGGAWLASVPPAAPFDDDSTDDSRNLVQIRQVCANGRVVIDSEDHRASCRGDVAYRDPRQIGLFKNERRLTDQPVLDFKIARDGTVYYRTVTGPFLYDENGRLESHASPVRLYLVSSSGDVVYLNDRDDIFQNEKELNRGPAGIRIREIETFFQGRKIFL
ncbi:MAG: hypothetical protein GWO19_10205, partial [Nitrospinaceae bacterium]|nr:hypothetical protein [Nitrospinaceae bacterium]